MSEIKIQNYNTSFNSRLKKYINKFWSKNHIFSKKNNIFDFQYKNNKHFSFFIATIKNEIIGMQGYINYNKYNDFDYKQIFLALWSVKPKAPIGVGLKLHQKIKSTTDCNFIGVIGLNLNTLQIHKWLGFKIFKMKKYVFVSDNIQNFKILNFKEKFIFKNNILHKKILFQKISSNSLNKLLNNKFYEGYNPRKSNNFIINRYLKHPKYKYEVFVTKNKTNKILGLFVFRIIDYKSSSAVKLIDYVGKDKYFFTINNLAKYVLDKNKSEYIIFYCYGLAKKYINQSGFTNINEKKIIAPQHFEPFVNENINIHCGYIKKNNINKIRIFLGDGDGDRPSF